MNKLPIVIALSIVGLTVTTVDVQACGESMFHTGQSMRYHAFITRDPANILIYRTGAANSDQKLLYSGLEKAGHKVTLVTDAAALAQTLSANHYDVIIANGSDMNAISADLGKSTREPALLAVLGNNPGEQQLRDHFPHHLSENAGLNQYLKSIEQTMQTRGT
jgi:hypothetical protein